MACIVRKHHFLYSSEKLRQLAKVVLLFCGALEVVSILDLNNSKFQRLIIQISISLHTTERYISPVSDGINKNLSSLHFGPSWIHRCSCEGGSVGLLAFKSNKSGCCCKKTYRLMYKIKNAILTLDKLGRTAAGGAPAIFARNTGHVRQLKTI